MVDMDNQIVVYKTSDGNELAVKADNIFKEGELEREVVCAKSAHTTRYGAIDRSV